MSCAEVLPRCAGSWHDASGCAVMEQLSTYTGKRWLVARAGGSKEGPLFSSFYVWEDIIPLSAGSADVIQIQVALCGVFSSFWVVVSKHFLLVNCTSVSIFGLFCSPTQERWSPQTIHLNT